LTSNTAEELLKHVQDLIQLIDETIKDVKGRIDLSKRTMGLQEIDFRPEKFDGSKQITRIVDEFVKYVAHIGFHAQTEWSVRTAN
jgi:hypothetical protein